MGKHQNIFATLTLLFSICLTSNACINGESMHLKNNTFLYQDRDFGLPKGHHFPNDTELKVALKEHERLYTYTSDIEYLSDKGVLLILLKKYKEAIVLYQMIEKMKPGRYSTASNIGTAYELIGNNDSALFWIKKSVEINPASHYNSEWIHVRILEAKIKGNKFINTKHLLNIDFGDEQFPKSNLHDSELVKLSKALYYQLNERISFIKNKDAIVGQLLFDLGNIYFLLNRRSDANYCYNLASGYGFSHKYIDKRKYSIPNNNYTTTVQKTKEAAEKIKRPTLHYLFGFFGAGFAIIIIAIMIARIKRPS